jgi:hypothetical protein
LLRSLFRTVDRAPAWAYTALMEHRVRLIHWNAVEARERAEHLRALGFDVNGDPIRNPPAFVKELAADPPAAMVIDLSRLPSQGRDLAVLIRQRKGTRGIPLVFVGGESEKVAPVRALLPDAFYTSWEEVGAVLATAIASPPAEPVLPGSVFAAYAGRPLATKLGIKARSVVGLVDAPQGFVALADGLPAGATVQAGGPSGCDVTLWFVQSREELGSKVGEMAAELRRGTLWIAWPKRGSDLAGDLTQQQVREVGLAAGLVDYKICSINETWSGLAFVRRGTK